MKKVNLNLSKKVGNSLDNYQKSVKGFVKVVTNEMKVNGTKSEYFISSLGALFSETDVLYNSGLKESRSEKTKRILESGLSLANKLSEKQKKESELFKTLSNKEALFVLLRNNLPCFYDNENRQFFAKQIKVGYNVANLSEETKVKFESNNKFAFVEFNTEEKPLQFFVNIDYIECLNDTQSGLNNVTRKQRKYLGGSIEESNVFYFDAKENIVTLSAFDRCNWQMLLPAFCYGYKKMKIEKEEQKKEEQKKEKQLAAKTAKFNILVEKLQKIESKLKEAKEPLKLKKQADNVLSAASNFDANEEQKQALTALIEKINGYFKA